MASSCVADWCIVETGTRPRAVNPFNRRLLALLGFTAIGCRHPPAGPIGPGTLPTARNEQGATMTVRIDAVEKDTQEPGDPAARIVGRDPKPCVFGYSHHFRVHQRRARQVCPLRKQTVEDGARHLAGGLPSGLRPHGARRLLR